MGSNIRDNFKKGCVELLLLSLLSEEDMYGYQMTQTMIKRSEGFLKISEGTMYPSLYKLESRQCISSYEKQAGNRMKRVYYHIEPEGRQYLQELVQEYRDTTRYIFQIIAPAEKKGDGEDAK